MNIEDAGDLIYYTYYMVDWGKVEQNAAGDRCISCGGPMLRVETVRDKRGKEYEGTVCQKCRTVLWVKTSP